MSVDKFDCLDCKKYFETEDPGEAVCPHCGSKNLNYQGRDEYDDDGQYLASYDDNGMPIQ